MKAKIEKLKLKRGDIVLVTVRGPLRSLAAMRKIQAQMRKIMPRGQRWLVKSNEITVGKFVEMLPEDWLKSLYQDLKRKFEPDGSH